MGNLGDSFGRIIDYILAAVLFIVAVLIILTRINGTVESYVQNETTSFVDTCRTTGQIDNDVYSRYIKKLYQLGNYNVTINHKQKMAYSNGNGTARIGYLSHPTNEITEYIYESGDEERAYPLNTGDCLEVKVTRKKGSSADQLLRFFIGGNSTEPTIIINYSGTVGSNG